MSRLPSALARTTGWSHDDVWRRGVIVSMLAGAAALVMFQASFRRLEAVIASVLFSGGGVSTYAGGDDVVVFILPDARAFALEVTPECTSAFLIAPFLVIGALMLLGRRLDPARVLLGIGVAAVLLLLANQLRLGVIAQLVTEFGLDKGYQWGHVLVGSLISVVFLGLSAVVALFIVTSGYEGRHHGRAV